MIKKSTFITLGLVILLLSSQEIFPQTKSDSIRNSLEKGSWSLQFQISDNFTLTTFQGSNISAKKHISDKSTLRFGLGLTAIVADRHYESEEINSYNRSSEDGVEDTFTQININCYYLYYADPRKKINLYFGAGPIFGYSNYDQTDMGNDVQQDTIFIETKNTRKTDGYSIGMHGLIGVEWFARKEISIHSEYGSSFSYRKDKSESILVRNSSQYGEEERSTKSEAGTYEFRSNGVVFGISVYF